MRIDYNGKCIDEFPSWVYTVTSNYGLNPIGLIKVDEFFKVNYGRKRPIVKDICIEKIEKVEISSGNLFKVGGSFGTFYNSQVSTTIKVGSDYYYIRHSISFQVSETVSQVTKLKVELFKQENKIPILVV